MKIRRIKIKKIVHADASVCNEEKRSSLGGRVFDNHANIKRSTWIDGSRICGRRPCNHFSRVIIDRGCRPSGPPRDGRMFVNVHISFDSGTAHGLPWSDHHSSRFRWIACYRTTCRVSLHHLRAPPMESVSWRSHVRERSHLVWFGHRPWITMEWSS